MVSPIFDPAVVQQKIDGLVARDAEIAKLAESREQQRQLALYGVVRQYEFPPNTTQVHVTNWVHQPWLKPIRFVFRNIPRPLRRLIKKLTTCANFLLQPIRKMQLLTTW